MEQKLISKECVPDNEVWVSPKTWEAPFGLKVNESQNKADNSASTPCPRHVRGGSCAIHFAGGCADTPCMVARRT